MVSPVFCIRDIKSGFQQPFIYANDAMAVRFFHSTVQEATSILKTHPQDFSLYRIGTFDDAAGLLTPEPVPVHLSDAVDALPVR